MANRPTSSDPRWSLKSRSSTHSQRSPPRIEVGESSRQPSIPSSSLYDGSHETGSQHSSRYSVFSGSTDADALSDEKLREEMGEKEDEETKRLRRRRRSGRKSAGGFLLDGPFGTLQTTAGLVDHSNKGISEGSTGQHSGKGDQEPSFPHSQEFVPSNDGVEELQVFKNRKEADRTAEEENATAQPVIDPTQIVHMALNLSESRRRNLSAGQLVAPAIPAGRRTASAAQPTGIMPLQGNFQSYAAGGNLRQYLNQQRQISRNLSPHTPRSSTNSRQTSASGPSLGTQEPLPYDYQFSSATLVRRDKARAAIELSIEYMRLLQFLPPLKPDALLLENSSFTTTGIPGTANVQLSRFPSYAQHRSELGRPYNPLQYIRNRRVRLRERRPLNPDSEEFEDVARVRNWVDSVERKSKEPDYRNGDRVLLPPYVSHLPDGNEERPEAQATKKPTRPRLDWIWSPADLLADAYWLEQGDNKTVIEDSQGRRIFEPKKPPSYRSPRSSKDIIRSSKEFFRDSDKRRNSHNEGGLSAPSEAHSGDESDAGSDRGRKRRLIPSILRDDGSRHRKKHSWNISKTRSSSRDSLSSSDESYSSSRKKQRRKKRLSLDTENIGPLERHVEEMLEQEASKEKPPSSAIVSPDTPDKWGVSHTALQSSTGGERDKANSTDTSKGRAEKSALSSPQLKHLPHAARGQREEAEPRSSYEDLDSTAPTTPVFGAFAPSIGIDLSPPVSRRYSFKEKEKSKRSRLGLFKSDREREHHDSTEDEGGKAGQQTIDETVGSPSKTSRTNPVKHMLHRKNESVNSLSGRPDSRGRKESKDIKEPSSSVSRFFRAGRLGEIVRTEGGKVQDFIFRRDPPSDQSDAESEKAPAATNNGADTDTDDDTAEQARPPAQRSQTLQDIGYTRSDLPSFKPTGSLESGPGDDDHILRQQISRRSEGTSSRFNRLKPPSIDVTAATSTTDRGRQAKASSKPPALDPEDNNLSLSRSGTHQASNQPLDRRGGTKSQMLPVTGLARLSVSPQPSRSRNSSLSSRRSSIQETQRHWSISDTTRPRSLSRGRDKPVYAGPGGISPSDIAHIRALLLSTGIKAHEIRCRATRPRDEPPPFLRRAADTAGARLITVSRKEEHVLAARILSKDLEVTTKRVREAVRAFQDETTEELRREIEGLRRKVEAEGALSPRTHALADQADEMTGMLSGDAPRRVNELNERIAGMVRGRRRRMRWLRRLGWAVVEWWMVGVLWWVWAVVVLIRIVLGMLRGVGRAVKWILWL